MTDDNRKSRKNVKYVSIGKDVVSMNNHIKVYLASPFFNQEQSDRETRVATKLRDLGFTVLRPREFGVLAPNATEEERQYIVKKDLEAINESDLLFCITNDKDMGCFTADTKIRTVNSANVYSNIDVIDKFTTLVNIRNISSLTTLVAYDLTNNQAVISATKGSAMTREAGIVSELKLTTGESIRCTSDHPFLTESNEYKLLSSLKPGDKLKCYDNSMKIVESIIPNVSCEPVYGMKVNQFHNYVLESGLVVKNSMIEYGYAIAKNKPRIILAEGFKGKVNVMLSATAFAVLTSVDEITSDVIADVSKGIKVNTYTGAVE